MWLEVRRIFVYVRAVLVSDIKSVGVGYSEFFLKAVNCSLCFLCTLGLEGQERGSNRHPESKAP